LIREQQNMHRLLTWFDASFCLKTACNCSLAHKGTELPPGKEVSVKADIAQHMISPLLQELVVRGRLESLMQGFYYVGTLPARPLPRSPAHLRRIMLELLWAGELRPGDYLPPLRVLAQQFAMSTQSVQTALRPLMICGVTLASNQGTVFGKFDSQQLQWLHEQAKLPQAVYRAPLEEYLSGLRPRRLVRLNSLYEPGLNNRATALMRLCLRRFKVIVPYEDDDRQYWVPNIASRELQQRIAACLCWLRRFDFSKGDLEGRQAFMDLYTG
jgi:DNA-binding transcriptional regulator YhcF (GntR family)